MWFGLARVLVVAALGVSGACSSDDPGPDGGDGGAEVDGGAPPGIDPPAPPVMGPCPEGWRDVLTETGLELCEPWPEAGAQDCEPGQAHFAGTPGCGPVGAACPSDGLPYDLPADRPVVYVLAGSSGGDGSRARPYGGLAEVGSVRAGTILALGRGRYLGIITLPAGAALWGACAAETELSVPVASDTEAVITTFSADVEVRNLRIGPSPRVGVAALGSGAAIRLVGVEVAGAQSAAVVVVDGARLEADGLHIRDTTPGVGPGNSGLGLVVQEGAAVQIRRAVIEHNHEVGALISGANAMFTDVVIRDTTNIEGRDLGVGLVVQERGSLLASEVVLERNVGAAALVFHDGTALDVDMLVLRDTRSNALDGFGGYGIEVGGGGSLDVRRAHFDGNRGIALHIAGEGGEATLSDIVVRRTMAQDRDGLGGRALNASEGAVVDMARAVLEQNQGIGINAYRNATIRLSDIRVRDTESRMADGEMGRGVSVSFTSRLEGVRVAIERSRGAGVYAYGAGTTVRLAHAVVTGVRERACFPDRCPDTFAGHGLLVYAGAELTIEDFLVTDAELCGAMISSAGGVSFARGEISESVFGVCLQTEGQDLSRLMQDVMYRGNETNLESTNLPVPEPGGALGG